MAFEQARIRVEKEKEFQELKEAIRRAFAPEAVERFLERVLGAGLRIRDFDGVVAKGVLERAGALAGGKAKDLYETLAITDRAQIKEFYLFKIEETGPELRAKYHRLYQYY
ncbi:MAG: hypothetical protein J2P13_07850 [Acidobacteria bacterium]|nr:hypothetical protein [Acidobacteriota bacterium]